MNIQFKRIMVVHLSSKKTRDFAPVSQRCFSSLLQWWFVFKGPKKKWGQTPSSLPPWNLVGYRSWPEVRTSHRKTPTAEFDASQRQINRKLYILMGLFLKKNGNMRNAFPKVDDFSSLKKTWGWFEPSDSMLTLKFRSSIQFFSKPFVSPTWISLKQGDFPY